MFLLSFCIPLPGVAAGQSLLLWHVGGEGWTLDNVVTGPDIPSHSTEHMQATIHCEDTWHQHDAAKRCVSLQLKYWVTQWNGEIIWMNYSHYHLLLECMFVLIRQILHELTVKCWDDCCNTRHKCYFYYASAMWLTDKIIDTNREGFQHPSWRKWWDSWRGRGGRAPEMEIREVNRHLAPDRLWPCQLLQVHLIFKAPSRPPYPCPKLRWDCCSRPGASIKRTRALLTPTAPSFT